jgi:glycosyltransferase involved in cell wall biosynthesis
VENQPSVAVLIPCHNEEADIGKVIDDFKRELPEAQITVFDNCCTDRTAEIAREHGASVCPEPRKGKGFVVEQMFRAVSADVYVMVDGDDTYSASHVHEMIAPILSGEADMVVGSRLAVYHDDSFRPLHVFGNELVRRLVNLLFQANLTDIMSGYRAYNRRITETIPVVSAGFEVETEITIEALYYGMKIVEVQVPYGTRSEGSQSKLNTFSDGARVLYKIFTLMRGYRPLAFFGSVSLVFLLFGLFVGSFPIYDYFAYGEIPHIPSAILATGLMIVASILMVMGILLDTINWRIRELHNVLTRNQGRR